MRSIKLQSIASIAFGLFVLSGCDENKPAPAGTKTSSSASAGAVSASAVSAAAKPSAPAPGGCRASGVGATQIGSVIGDVYGFASDVHNLYYTTWQTYGSRGDLGLIRKDGLGGKGLASLDLEPRGLAVDDDTLFYTSGIRLVSIPKAGGMTTTLEPQFSAKSIAIDAANVYGIPGDYGPYDRVAKIAKKGGAVDELATARRPAGEGLKGYSNLAVDASGLYVADSGGNRILRFPLSGGKPKPVTSGTKKPYDVAIDDSNVFFSLAGGDLMMVPKSGGKATKLASGLVENARIAGDSMGVYTTFAAGGESSLKIAKVGPKDGSLKAIAAVPESQSVQAIAVDERCVYWVQRVDAVKGIVYAAPR